MTRLLRARAHRDEHTEDPNSILRPLVQRLTVAAGVLLDQSPDPRDEPAEEAAALLTALLDRVHGDPSPAPLWLMLTALGGAFPSPEQTREALRHLRAVGPLKAFSELLRGAYERALESGATRLEMDVVSGEVVVDVDFCATSDLHTGIQRVVRETLPRWERDHELVMVGWTKQDGAFRGLDESEQHRVLRWGAVHEPVGIAPTNPQRIVVPWQCAVVLPENPEPQRCPALSGMAQYSGSDIRVIGYDCIPIVSPELIHPGLPDRFVRYLSVVKHSRTVAGISASATTEFEGFARMLTSQGLAGPLVAECSLPVEVPPVAGPPPATKLPVIMSVGSFEPRKNQVAVLHAAERLWREGLEFEVQFVGGGGYRTQFDVLRQRLVAIGRPITVQTAINDGELWQTYKAARFTVFASLHEGFGLPVAESLALGTPALTTNFGSTNEIVQGGGALAVDSRDDEALLTAMRRMLTDDALIERLRAEAASRPPRTWDTYADELWNLLIEAPGRPSEVMT